MKLRTLLVASVASLLTAIVVAQGQVPGINSTLNSVFTLVYEASTSKPTYSATIAGVNPASSATDVCTLTGSATKTVRVRRIIFAGHNNSVVADPVAIIKRSTADTNGNGTHLVTTAYDSKFSATTVAQAEFFITNPTVGTQVGVLADIDIVFPITTSVVPTVGYTFEFGKLGAPVFLRGVAQQLAVNLNGRTVAGPISCTFEWTEDNDS